MIKVTDDVEIDESEIEETFITAGGPGGQHVNKAATAVQIRFDAAGSPSLDEAVRSRLLKLAGKRLNAEGQVVMTARRFRSQARNREDAVERLVALVRAAAAPTASRKETRIPGSARRKRLQEKRRASQIKTMRRAPPSENGG